MAGQSAYLIRHRMQHYSTNKSCKITHCHLTNDSNDSKTIQKSFNCHTNLQNILNIFILVCIQPARFGQQYAHQKHLYDARRRNKFLNIPLAGCEMKRDMIYSHGLFCTSNGLCHHLTKK